MEKVAPDKTREELGAGGLRRHRRDALPLRTFASAVATMAVRPLLQGADQVAGPETHPARAAAGTAGAVGGVADASGELGHGPIVR